MKQKRLVTQLLALTLIVVLGAPFFAEPTASAQPPMPELVAAVPPAAGVRVQGIEAIQGLDPNPNVILFSTQNRGSGCGGGTPASVWKLTLDPSTGQMLSLDYVQSLPLIQNVRRSLFESSAGTLFIGSGWCGYKPPYYSKNSGATWQPASVGVHPPNSTFSFAEFQGEIYAGTGYEPYRGQVYRWLGDTGSNYWQLVHDISPPRSIVWTMAAYHQRLFVGSMVYWYTSAGCEVSVPVYVSEDGTTFGATTGIPPCYDVLDLLVVDDQLVARVKTERFSPYAAYSYRWDQNEDEWQFVADYELGYTGVRLVAHEGAIYASGKAPGDTSKGIYRSGDLGLTWEQIAVLQNPDVWSLAVHQNALYIGTSYDASDRAYIYRIRLNQPPTADAGGPYSGNEGSAIALAGANASDPDGNDLTYAWTVSNSEICSFDESTVLNPDLTCTDNGTYQVTLEVSDGQATASSETTVTVDNVAPAVDSITVPWQGPVNIDEQASSSVEVAFSDPAESLDDHYTCSFDFDSDGTGDILKTVIYGVDGGTCTAPLANDTYPGYAEPGVYTVKVAVTDKDQGSGIATAQQYIVIYDSLGGFVTGGGWIDSPPGACQFEDCTENTTGKATFGFVSKYKPGANTPTGQTQFQFKAGDLNFHSGSYDWLVVAGPHAKFKGTGTINGEGNYGFMLTATDSAINGGGDSDGFRIKIWDSDNGDTLVYDNKMGEGDDSNATTALGGGSIVIHK